MKNLLDLLDRSTLLKYLRVVCVFVMSLCICIRGDADKLVIIVTRRNMNLLAEVKTIYVDGTFEVCPKLFYQLVTIYLWPNIFFCLWFLAVRT